jgi:DNA-binding NtrC family response regulator
VRSPQILVFEQDGHLKLLLEKTAEERRWALRESRQVEPCLRLLAEGGPSVLVIKSGRDLERELGLLERAAWAFPATATVLVGDAGQAALAGLAWDLGADYVLVPPQPRERLPEVVAALMPDVVEA